MISHFMGSKHLKVKKKRKKKENIYIFFCDARFPYTIGCSCIINIEFIYFPMMQNEKMKLYDLSLMQKGETLEAN